MIRVIVINGSGTSGKDTFIDLFTEVCKDTSIGESVPVHRFSSVDEVKHFATLMGWDGVKDDKGRRFLSDIKDAWTRYSNGPYRYMVQMYHKVQAQSYSPDGFIFFHVREPDEIDKVVKGLNAVTLHIERPSVEPDSFDNHADRNVKSYDYDYYVVNDGSLYELKWKAFDFLTYLLNLEVKTDAIIEADL